MRMSLALCLLFLIGCSRPPAVREAGSLKREAILSYARNNNILHKAEQEGYREEAQAHAKTLWKWDLEKLTSQADATGKVDAKQAQSWVLKITGELEQNFGKADVKIKAVQTEVEKAQKDLQTVLQLDEMLDKFQDAGVAPEWIGKASDTIGEILKKR